METELRRFLALDGAGRASGADACGAGGGASVSRSSRTSDKSLSTSAVASFRNSSSSFCSSMLLASFVVTREYSWPDLAEKKDGALDTRESGKTAPC